MVYWQKFDPEEFEFEFDEQKLAAHKISVDEAAEIIWNGFDVRRNKRYYGGYEIVGRTDSGRKLFTRSGRVLFASLLGGIYEGEKANFRG